MKIPAFEPFMEMGWDEIHPLYDELENAQLEQDTVESWMTSWSELSKLVDERYTRLAIATELDTTDEEAERAYHAFLDELFPKTRTADQKLKEKLLESGLVPEGMEIALKKMRVKADLFREENLPLMTEESKLGTEYSKIFGDQTIEWEGEELTLTQAKSALLDIDREVRRRIWELISERQLTDREAINDLWVKFMDIRSQLPVNADFEDYRSFRWQQRVRLDYEVEDSKQFLDAVLKVAVPAATRVYQRYAERMGIDSVRPWDLLNNQSTFNLPAIEAFETEEELISHADGIFNKLDPELGVYFKIMQDEDLLDLMNRKGKGPGAFCAMLATTGQPFIFMNSVGRATDVGTLFHESGHAFHDFEQAKLPYHHQWHPGLEFAEVASMAMELLAEPYLAKEKGGFMSEKDAAITRLENLEGGLLFWPYMAVVVAFQHWVYENHELGSDPAACDQKWAELIDQYMPAINWEGYEDVKQTGWHRKLHIHQAPFYYIEYGLASLGAFQILRKAKEDQPKALKDYRKALALGGTASLPELYQAAGAKLAFDAETLGEIVEMIEGDLAELEAKVF
jgi:oligoendopeptidase F